MKLFHRLKGVLTGIDVNRSGKVEWPAPRPDPPERILVEKIKVLNLDDGDILCVLNPGVLNDQAYERLKESINEHLPQLKGRVLIFEQGIDLKVIRSAALKAELDAAP